MRVPDSEPPRTVKKRRWARSHFWFCCCHTLGSGTSFLSPVYHRPFTIGQGRQREKLFEKFSVLLKSAL